MQEFAPYGQYGLLDSERGGEFEHGQAPIFKIADWCIACLRGRLFGLLLRFVVRVFGAGLLGQVCEATERANGSMMRGHIC